LAGLYRSDGSIAGGSKTQLNRHACLLEHGEFPLGAEPPKRIRIWWGKGGGWILIIVLLFKFPSISLSSNCPSSPHWPLHSLRTRDSLWLKKKKQSHDHVCLTPSQKRVAL
jgi:hypothetical protein